MNPQMMSLVPAAVVVRGKMVMQDDRPESGKRLRKVKDQVKVEKDVKKLKRPQHPRKEAPKFIFLSLESKSSGPLPFQAPKPKPVVPLPPLPKGIPKPAIPLPPIASPSPDPLPFQAPKPKPVIPLPPLPKGIPKPAIPLPPIALPPGFSSDHQFTKEAFLSKRVFHLHPFRKKRTNRYFGPFIAAGGATIGDAAEYPVYSELMAGLSSSSEKDKKLAIRDAITKVSGPKRVPWIRMWHEQLQIGDFIVLRHAYNGKRCPQTPSRLIDDATGGYIGSVYVLGVVTDLPAVDGDCVQEIRERILQNSSWRGWEEEGHIHSTFCPVKFLRMGFKAKLKAETKNQMMNCTKGEMAPVCGKLPEDAAQSMLLDLWENATIPITPQEFGRKNFKAPEFLSCIGLEYGSSLFRHQWT